MKHQWCVRRQATPYPDGQQRWDRAYQLLLQWARASGSPALPPESDQKEEADARRVVRAGLDHRPDSGTDH